jgi:O-antigen ligase
MKSPFRRTSPIVVIATLAISFYLAVTQWSALAVIGGFTFHITDLFFGLAAIYCVVGFAITGRRPSVLESLLLTLCGLLFLNFGRGVVEASYNAAGVQFRNFSGFIAVIAFMYFWGREFKLDWILNMFLVLGWAIALLGLTRLALGNPEAFVREELDLFREPRIFNAPTALMLGEVALIAFNRMLSTPQGSRREWYAGSLTVFLGLLLISQQRTATFATLAGLAVISAFAPGYYRSRMIATTGVVFLAGCMLFWVVWIASSGDISPYIPRAFSMIEQEDSTFGWRLEQWDDYGEVYSREPLFDQIIGQPMGALRLVADTDSVLFVVAHNEYVQVLLSAGAVGALLYGLVMMWASMQGLMRLRSASSPDLSSRLRLAVAILSSHIVFSIGYILPNEQGLLLAIALQLIAPAPGFTRKILLTPRGLGRMGGLTQSWIPGSSNGTYR